MTLQSGFGKCSLFVLSANGWKDQNMNSCFYAKENPNMEVLFDWPIVLQYDVKTKYRLISRKFLGMKFFHPSVRLTNQKPRAFVSVWWTNQITLFPFVCCFCFVRAFPFQGLTKIALLKQVLSPFNRKVLDTESEVITGKFQAKALVWDFPVVTEQMRLITYSLYELFIRDLSLRSIKTNNNYKKNMSP